MRIPLGERVENLTHISTLIEKEKSITIPCAARLSDARARVSLRGR
jgi:hypothetical protein